MILFFHTFHYVLFVRFVLLPQGILNTLKGWIKIADYVYITETL